MSADQRLFRQKKRGRKPVAVKPAAAVEAPSAGEVLAAFDGRGSLEDYLKQQLAATAAQFDALIVAFQKQRAVAEANGLVNEAAKAANGTRAALKDKQQFILSITKQFSLMAQLEKPLDSDPKLTPIRFVLHAEPPAESIVEKPFCVLPEDEQPGAKKW